MTQTLLFICNLALTDSHFLSDVNNRGNTINDENTWIYDVNIIEKFMETLFKLFHTIFFKPAIIDHGPLNADVLSSLLARLTTNQKINLCG